MNLQAFRPATSLKGDSNTDEHLLLLHITQIQHIASHNSDSTSKTNPFPSLGITFFTSSFRIDIHSSTSVKMGTVMFHVGKL